jgi:hypothetical protein
MGSDDVLDGRAVLGFLQAEVLIRMPSLGIEEAFNSANWRLAATAFLRMVASEPPTQGFEMAEGRRPRFKPDV